MLKQLSLESFYFYEAVPIFLGLFCGYPKVLVSSHFEKNLSFGRKDWLKEKEQILKSANQFILEIVENENECIYVDSLSESLQRIQKEWPKYINLILIMVLNHYSRYCLIIHDLIAC